MEQPADVRRNNSAVPWFGVALGAALLTLPAMVWDTFGTPPDWLTMGALAVLGVGLVCFVVATVVKARSDGVSALRLVGRVLWAPIRFIVEFLP